MTALTLDQHLEACAAETKLRIGADTSATHCAALYAALAGDPAMAAAAQTMIQDGAPLETRDFITRWRSSLLRQALGS
jgi:hypothetical protein